MSASQYRSQLESKRKQRVQAEQKAGDYRSRESAKRAEAAKARQAAAKTNSQSTVRSKLREADRKERDAAAAGKKANDWQAKAAGYAKAEASLQAKLARAETAESEAAERRRLLEQQRTDRSVAAENAMFGVRISRAEDMARHALRQLPAPKPEKLRVLLLGSSSEGDLRVGREQKRIRAAVEAAIHRDQIELDVRPAATAADLLDGVVKFRPHIVHFSGHSSDSLIVLEGEQDELHEGVSVTAAAFASAVGATDEPPTLVLLNSCNSASQIDALVEQVAPFAIGMADSIADGDAINYAAQFYASIANGQSIWAAHQAGRARLELDGLGVEELPRLASAPDVDSANTVLVEPMER